MTDQFYTPEKTADRCSEILSDFCEEHLRGDLVFVEPSAGTGVFLERLSRLGETTGMDTHPAHEEVIEQDFLTWQAAGIGSKTSLVVAGNPPFGKRGKLAKDFILKGAAIADTVAFILPMCFTKHQAQKHIPEDMFLHISERLGSQDFVLPSGKTRSLNTVFQIWSRTEPRGGCLRRTEPEPKTHPDFSVRQYNNTCDALRVFSLPFDFAVPCQGWQDYTRRETSPEACEKTKQWMLFQTETEETETRLREIDFGDMAEKTGTSVPGFRINDVVEHYSSITS